MGLRSAGPRLRGAAALAARPLGEAAVHLPPGVIDGVADGPAGLGKRAQHRVGVEQAERARHLVLLLQHQPVGAAAAHLVQGVPDVHDQFVGRAYPGARRGRHPGGGDRLDGVHVPQAAPRFLQVGFEQEGELAEPLRALRPHRRELGQADTRRRPASRRAPPHAAAR